MRSKALPIGFFLLLSCLSAAAILTSHTFWGDTVQAIRTAALLPQFL